MFKNKSKSKDVSPADVGASDVGTTQPPPQEMVVSVQTDAGCVREANEDCGRFFKPSDPALLASKGLLIIVADGMGGHAAGEVASRMAVDVVNRVYYSERGEAIDALKKAFAEANREIFAAAQADENRRGMGTTCTALVLLDGAALSAHVGDSRLYMLRGGEIYLLTEDHSAVMEMVKHGIITPEEARTHADKNIILRALGTNADVAVATWDEPLPVREGDQFLLCSDGLYDLVEDAEIKSIVTAAADPHAACEKLIALAKQRGGHDNITVAIISPAPKNRPVKRGLKETREVEVRR